MTCRLQGLRLSILRHAGQLLRQQRLCLAGHLRSFCWAIGRLININHGLMLLNKNVSLNTEPPVASSPPTSRPLPQQTQVPVLNPSCVSLVPAVHTSSPLSSQIGGLQLKLVVPSRSSRPTKAPSCSPQSTQMQLGSKRTGLGTGILDPEPKSQSEMTTKSVPIYRVHTVKYGCSLG